MRDEPTVARALVVQLLGALAICINHLPITLLSGVNLGWFGPVTREIGVWGVSIFMITAGFLLHFHAAEMVPRQGRLRGAVELIFRRYWRLLCPILVVLVVDIYLVHFINYAASAQTYRALPFDLTLTQTWIYQVLAGSSLGQAFAGANMAWLGSVLFGLTIVYALAARYLGGLGARGALIGFACFAVLYAVFYWQLEANQDSITAAMELRFAGYEGAYSYWVWLFEYAPYFHIPAFLCGVFLAQLARKREAGRGPFYLAAVAGVLLCLFGGTEMPHFLGLNTLILIGLSLRWGRRATAGDWMPPSRLVALSRRAYEIFVLHLVIFQIFSLNVPPPPTFDSVVLLTGRVVAVTALMLLFCYGIATFFTDPTRRFIERLFGLRAVEDRLA